MKTLASSLALGLCLALLSAPLPTQAQQPNAAASNTATQNFRGGRAMTSLLPDAARLAQIETLLKLRPEQQTVWQNWRKATLANREALASMPPQRAAMATLPSTTRMEMMLAQMQQRHSTLEQQLTATQQFYAALDTGQQTSFDQATRPSALGGRGRMAGAGMAGMNPACPVNW